MQSYEQKIAELEEELKAKDREITIEAALERVRAISISIQNTSELQKVVHAVAQELHNMEMDVTGVFLAINNNEIDKKFTFWGSAGVAEKYVKKATIPFLNRPIYTTLAEAATKDAGFFTEEYCKEEKIEFFKHLFKYPPYNSSSPEWKEQLLSCEGGYTRSVFVSHYTSIFVVNFFGRKLSDSDNNILIRFGKVFEQSYIRFLDLQKAEVQAKNAFKEAALDRIRAEIASMRTAEDLNRITPVIWQELKTLEVPFIRCGISIIDETEENIRLYLTTPGGKALGALNLSFTANDLTRKTVDHWKKGIVYKEHWDEQQFINWTTSMVEMGQIDNAEDYRGAASSPESLYLHFIPFAQGMLYVGDIAPLTDEKLHLVVAIAKVFSIAYARYEDFKNLEEAKNKIEITVRELKAVQEKLKDLDRVKSRFFANISHEFRTPLTLINGPLEDLLNGGKPQKFIDLAPAMYRNSKRLLQLINQLLDLSKLDAGSYKLNTSREDIVPFIKQIVHSFSSLAKRKNIELELKVDDQLEARISEDTLRFYFDDDVIEKIVTNLLSNAIKFTPEGGKVTASLGLPKNKKDVLEIKVEDTGVGIPAKKIPFIFNRFYQVDDSDKRYYEGSGIGLALLKELVEIHQGNISVSSEVNKGTIFYCYLPMNKKIISGTDKKPDKSTLSEILPEEPVQIPEDELSNTDKDAPVVLVVEDQADVRKYIREKLQDNYIVMEAGDGKEGLETALNEIPDLVISDVMMPRMDGFELCRTLKTNDRTSHIPIIILTARAEDSDKITGLETGADAYLVKPFNSQELSVRVNNLIIIRKKLRKAFSNKLVIKPADITVTSRDQLFMEKLLAIVESHIGDTQFSVDALGKEMAMSASQLNRKLKAIIDQSSQQFIRSVRMERARDLLKKDGGAISEISWLVGFEDPGYFSKVFKKQFGCLPSEKEKFPE